MEDVCDVDQGQLDVDAAMKPATVEQCQQVIQDLVLQNTYLREQLA